MGSQPLELSKLPENHDPFQPYKVEKFDDGLSYDTLQVHAGHRPDKETHARAVPIYNSVSFIFTDSAHAKRVCATEEAGYFYSRVSNPTVAVFEKRAAALEGGTAAVGTCSGQAAIFNTIICLAGAGDNVVASINLYGGTYSLFKTLLPRLGIEVRWAKLETREEYAKHVDEKTKLFFVESIGNPRCSIPDLQGLADVAHENHIPFVVDNTFGACGTWCRPKDFGADIILHSATKWMGGHGTTVGGVIIDCGTFDWGAAGERFPRMIHKDGPMSFSYWKAFGNISFAMAMRIDILMEVGSILSPASAQQLLIGMETLSLRCERHASNTIAVARFLESHPRIAWVNYPGLEKNQYHENANRYLKNGYGGVLSFGPKGGDVASKMLLNYVKVISHQTNVGDSKTLATHPWNSTHVIMSEKDRREAGITPAFIRFSVGTEDVRDIIGDLDQALNALPEDIVNAHDEKLEAKFTNGVNGDTTMADAVPITNGKVDYTDADVSLSKSNVPLGRQTAVGNWLNECSRDETMEKPIGEKQSDGASAEPAETTVTHEENALHEDVYDVSQNKRLNRILDVRIIPLCCWLYLLNFLDRGNIGNARVLNQETGDDMLHQTRMTSTDYAITLSVFSLAYALFEVPSNWVMKHYVRPSVWLALLLGCWGVVTIGFAGVKNYATVLALRLLIGVFEAGFFPGIVYLITIWYRHNERALRIALVIAFCNLAGAFGGAIAYGIGHVNGAGGLQGFRWLFIIEGLITVLSVLPTLLILPDYPARAKFLTADDKRLAEDRLKDRGGGYNREHATRKEILATFVSPRMLAHYFAYIANVVLQGSFTFYSPTIVTGLGYKSIQAQLMTVPPWCIGFCVAISLSYSADRFDARGWHIVGASIVGGAGWLTAGLLPHDAYTSRYGCLCLAAVGAFPCAPSMTNWVTCNTPSLLTIPFAIAVHNSCAGIGQIIAQWIWKPAEASQGYPTGNFTCAACCFFVAIVAAGLRLLYAKMNRDGARDARGEKRVWSY